jgi:hypothetical protein
MFKVALRGIRDGKRMKLSEYCIQWYILGISGVGPPVSTRTMLVVTLKRTFRLTCYVQKHESEVKAKGGLVP